MMKKIFNLLCLFPVLTFGQSQNSNYIKTTTYRVPVSASIPSPGVSQASQTITYFDGLGRPIQHRAFKMSSTEKDIVTHISYDALGRENKNYLPFVSQTASLDYSSTAGADVLTFYGSPSFALTGNPNFEATAYPYSEKLFESSPLNRVQKQAAPGEAWKIPAPGDTEDHTLKIERGTNISSDQVKHFIATAGTNAVNGYYPVNFSQAQNYSDGDLNKTIIKNENWIIGKANTTEEYKDKDGQVILKRTFGESIVNEQPVFASHDTYYVYDQHGNLSFIIPPLSNGSNGQHDGLCYQYRYDSRNRMVEKKLPGKEWEFIVYDKSDKIVAFGPSYSPFGDQVKGWLVSKYDVFGRTAYTGWYNGLQALSSENRNAMQEFVNASTAKFESRVASNTIDNISTGYSNNVFPTNSFSLLDISYYDNYTFPYALSVPTSVENQPVATTAKGLPTGSWTRVLTSADQYKGNIVTVFYDRFFHPIKSFQYTYNDGYTYTDMSVDEFTGRVNYTVTHQKTANSDSEIKVRNFYSYSAHGRLLLHTHSINDDPVQLLSQNQYDELGRLIKKNVGRNTDNPIQKIDYSYNIRGWLKGINNINNLSIAGDPTDLFAFKISYNTIEGTLPGVDKQFNGNLSETYWRSSSDNILRKYSYRYDNLNRLKDAIYQKNGEIQNSYNESLTYDMNGNIKHLLRHGALDSQNTSIEIDNLDYTYDSTNSNRLMKVFDNSRHQEGFKDDSVDGINDPEDDYAYDDFGNLTKDQNKKIINITYNHLNLPVKILFEGNRTIEYLYDARGKKLQKSIGNSSTRVNTDYVSGFQYQHGILQFFHTTEGYVNCTKINGTDKYSYAFNYVDHLGNIRMSYGIDPATNVLKIIEENHYYPFGLKHSNYNSASLRFQDAGSFVALKAAAAPTNPPGGGGDESSTSSNSYKFKFNGQELQNEFSLNVTAMDYRQYDHAIGRFNGMDMLAELVPETSPYRFANNNPNFWSDPSGLNDATDLPTVTLVSFQGGGGGGVGMMGFSMPTFFSWGNAQNEGMGIPPLPSFLGIPAYLPYDMTKVRHQLEEVEITHVRKNNNSNKKNIENAKKIKELTTALESIVALAETYRNATKGTRVVGKVAGYATTITDIVINLLEYEDGTVSGMRVTYRIGGVLTSAVVGASVGGPLGFVAGLLVGATFNQTEKAYDTIAPQITHSFNHFIRNVNSSIARYH